jgi:hypothetical protein
MRTNLLNYIEQERHSASEKQKHQSELEIARHIQKSALSTTYPEDKTFAIATTMIPAQQVGGDFYDFFFIDGFITMIKASIFILASIQQEILAQETFAEIYSIFTDVENKVTNPKNMIFFICQKKFNMTKDDLIEFTKRLEVPIVNKMKDGELKSGVRRTAEEINALLKRKNIYCDPNWPFCLYEPSTFNIKEFFIVKENKAPFIIEDYYYIKNRGYQDDINDIIDGVIDTDKTTNKEILIERHKHICDDQKIVEISQNFSKLENALSNEHADKTSDKSQEMKIYELLKTFKDVDTIINYIKEQLKKKEEKIVLKNEIDIINEKNKNFVYYTKNYFQDK